MSDAEKAAKLKKKSSDEKDSENSKLNVKKNEKKEKIERIAGDTKPLTPLPKDNGGNTISVKSHEES